MKRIAIFLTAWMLACVPGTVAAEDAIPVQLASCFAPPCELTDDSGDYESPLVFYDGDKAETSDDWQRRRKEILDRWYEIMGP